MLVSIVIGGSGAAAAAGPSAAALEAYREADDGGRVALMWLVSPSDRAAGDRWLLTSERTVRDLGGERRYAGDLDVVPGDPARQFEHLVIDELPSREAGLEALRALTESSARDLDRSLVLAGRPASSVALFAIGIAARVYEAFAGVEVAETPALEGVQAVGGGDTGMSEAARELFASKDQRASLAVANFNAYRERAVYDREIDGDPNVSGEEAYGRYGLAAIRQVFARGGRPLWMAEDVSALVGPASHPLAQSWDDFVLVFYPSRLAIRDMTSQPGYRAHLHHRGAGIERAIVIPGSPAPEFDPAP
jgi:uncharacterized protein (DUF1330 family)